MKRRVLVARGYQDPAAMNTAVGHMIRFEHSLSGREYGPPVTERVRTAASFEEALAVIALCGRSAAPATRRKWARALEEHWPDRVEEIGADIDDLVEAAIKAEKGEPRGEGEEEAIPRSGAALQERQVVDGPADIGGAESGTAGGIEPQLRKPPVGGSDSRVGSPNLPYGPEENEGPATDKVEKNETEQETR